MKSNFIEWSNEDVVNWMCHDMKLLNINYDLIKSHEINGRDLIDLTEDNLKQDLKITKLHDRKHLMRKICELMRNFVERNENFNETNTNTEIIQNDQNENKQLDENSEIISPNDIISNSEYLMKIFKVKFGDKIITMKCANNIKIEHVIKECLDVLNLNPKEILNETKNKNENSTSNKKSTNMLYYDINDFYLTDKNKIIFPKENFVCDILHVYSAEKSNRTQSFIFYLHFNNEDKLIKIKNSNRNMNINNINNLSTSAINNSSSNNPNPPVKIFESHDTKINKEISNSISNSQSISNIYKNIPNKNNNNRSSNDISIERTKTDNNYKDFSITETAVKNRFVSFEALDNLEKNGYSFINKKLNNHLNKTKEEKVTINSFYNISNLNNFNEKSLKSIQSLNTSNDNRKSAGKIVISSSHKKANINGNVVKSNKKKAIISLLNFNSKKLDFDEMSEKDEEKPVTKIENKNEKKYSTGKIELDEYMKMLSYRTCLDTSNESEINKSKKEKNSKNDHKYYINTENLSASVSDNKPVSFRNIINHNNMNDANKSSEAEIENFLKSIKNKNSANFNTSVTNNNSHHTNLYYQNTSTQSYLNSFNLINNNINKNFCNRLSENNSKNIFTKNKMRKLIFENIASKERKDKNLDSSISE